MTSEQLAKKVLSGNVAQVVPTVRRFCDLHTTDQVVAAYELCASRLVALTTSAPVIRDKLSRAQSAFHEWLSERGIDHKPPITSSVINGNGGVNRGPTQIRSADTKVWQRYKPLASELVLTDAPMVEQDSVFRPNVTQYDLVRLLQDALALARRMDSTTSQGWTELCQAFATIRGVAHELLLRGWFTPDLVRTTLASYGDLAEHVAAIKLLRPLTDRQTGDCDRTIVRLKDQFGGYFKALSPEHQWEFLASVIRGFAWPISSGNSWFLAILLEMMGSEQAADWLERATLEIYRNTADGQLLRRLLCIARTTAKGLFETDDVVVAHPLRSIFGRIKWADFEPEFLQNQGGHPLLRALIRLFWLATNEQLELLLEILATLGGQDVARCAIRALSALYAEPVVRSFVELTMNVRVTPGDSSVLGKKMRVDVPVDKLEALRETFSVCTVRPDVELMELPIGPTVTFEQVTSGTWRSLLAGRFSRMTSKAIGQIATVLESEERRNGLANLAAGWTDDIGDRGVRGVVDGGLIPIELSLVKATGLVSAVRIWERQAETDPYLVRIEYILPSGLRVPDQLPASGDEWEQLEQSNRPEWLMKIAVLAELHDRMVPATRFIGRAELVTRALRRGQRIRAPREQDSFILARVTERRVSLLPVDDPRRGPRPIHDLVGPYPRRCTAIPPYWRTIPWPMSEQKFLEWLEYYRITGKCPMPEDATPIAGSPIYEVRGSQVQRPEGYTWHVQSVPCPHGRVPGTRGVTQRFRWEAQVVGHSALVQLEAFMALPL